MKKAKRRGWLFRGFLALLAAVTVVAVVGVIDAWADLGTTPRGARRDRLAASKQYRSGKFVDTIPRVDPEFWAVMRRWLAGAAFTQPTTPLPVVHRRGREFADTPPSGLRVTWFGHSTLLVEIEGRRVLFDPVWSERCSPSQFVGPKRFHEPPMALAELPRIDAVAISHDHYDHLDYATIEALKVRDVVFVVPLGVGAHLEYWGIAPERIRELDWWEETTVRGLKLVATPARHFSGRGLGGDRTLWSGWALIGAERRVYYSGDTAMFEGFRQIGERLGPFDATLIEAGAYDAMWADVHLGPEQAVEAHRRVRGRVLLPVHWGTFNLALHTWVEPIERVIVAARAAGVTVVTPKPGESVDPLHPVAAKPWWPEVPWKTAAEAPVVSSGLRHVLE
jgi:L-ascorbate metabolism protein UlaG (beta-lactamase superfamily)